MLNFLVQLDNHATLLDTASFAAILILRHDANMCPIRNCLQLSLARTFSERFQLDFSFPSSSFLRMQNPIPVPVKDASVSSRVLNFSRAFADFPWSCPVQPGIPISIFISLLSSTVAFILFYFSFFVFVNSIFHSLSFCWWDCVNYQRSSGGCCRRSEKGNKIFEIISN